MATYTTFFLCKPAQLPKGFPGWQLPLAKPVRRKFRNPFTGKTSIIETREPEWPDASDEDVGELADDYDLETGEDDYEGYLARRLPPFVSKCPHWAAKGLTQVELDPLLHAAGVEVSLECALYGPPSTGAIVQQLPAEVLAKLKSIELKSVAKQWAAELSMPEHKHSGMAALTSKEAQKALQSIMALASQRATGQQMYLLTEA